MKHIRAVRTRLIYALLLFAPALSAQRYNFKFYGEEEGLQNLAVQTLVQDRAGFLWVGTQNGLFRYDGNRFRAFGKTDGLPGTRIESLHEAVDGTLWVGTRVGVARRRGDRFEPLDLKIARGVIGREGIASDRQGRLYFATESGLVTGASAPSGSVTFARIPLDSPSSPGTPEAAQSVYVDAPGQIWFGCGNGFCRVENGVGEDVTSAMGLPAEHWNAILSDRDGNLWVRSERSLYFRPRGAIVFQAHPAPPESTNTYPSLAMDPQGKLLVPTFRGIARQNGDHWEIIGARDGLTTNDISTIIQDREGSMWVGLLGSGLARWLGYGEWKGWTDREGLSRESVWSIARDRHKRLWVGTQFGLNYAIEKEGRLEWRKQPLEGIDFIRTLAAHPDGSLWIGGDWGGGLHRLNPQTGQSRRFGPTDGLANDDVLHVMHDGEGQVWVCTRHGLFHAQPSGSNSTVLRFEQMQPPDTRPDEIFLTAIAARSGDIWVAGSRGLARFSKNHWTRFTTQDGLKFNMIAELAEDPDGSIWIGYREAYGITRVILSAAGPRLEHYTTTTAGANGPRSDKSIFLGFDAHGRLWAGTDHGVDVYDHKAWRHYGRSDGLIWDDCNSQAFLADPDGVIWIGTSRGLSRFQASLTTTAPVPPPVVVTEVKLGDRRVDLLANYDVPYAANSIQVRFAALTFLQESSVLFRYRMSGVGRDWIETNERELNYSGLPPGQYTLEVEARNARGVWSTEPARLEISIRTPWWLAWWFRLAAVAVALLLGHAMWRRRTRRLHADRLRLETAVEERTSELLREKQRLIAEKARSEEQHRQIEQLLAEAQTASRFKSDFLANMSHEIRTPMNGILGMTDLVLATNLSEEQRGYLQTARVSAESLLVILNDILDFSKIEAGRLDLNPIQFSVCEMLTETAKLFTFPLAKKNLRLDTHIATDVPELLVGDADRLRQVLLNLIGNAVKFTATGGIRVTVELASEDAAGDPASLTLHFAVRDSGIGIPADKRELIFEAFRQADASTTRKFGGTGLGLAISTRLVEMMGGRIRVESEPGHGSTFHFTARFGRALEESEAAVPPSASLRSMLEAVGTTNGNGTHPGGLKILLAEDNIVNQRLVLRLLEKRGHRVTLAGTGHEAVAAAEREEFDLILMDVQMPEMDGLEATIHIRKRERAAGIHTPIVALTAYTMKGDRERCLDAGMDSYVNKPIDAVKFLEVVESTAAAFKV